MPDNFDPYHEWLGIPPGEQPPHHYRLLGIPAFEESPTVIAHAADQRMAHLRTFQAGKHSALSQKLLNEVAAAKVRLLTAAQKAAYDEQLRARLATQQPPQSPSRAEELPSALEFLKETKPAPQPPSVGHGVLPAVPQRTGKEAKQADRSRLPIYLGAAAVAAVVGLALWWGMSGPATPIAQRSEKVEKIEPPPSVRPPADISGKLPNPENQKTPAQAVPAILEPSKPSQSLVASPPKKTEPKVEEETTPPAKEDQSAEAKPPSKDSPAGKPESEAEKVPAKKIEPPSAEEQKRLVRQIDEVYMLGEAKDRVALARKLLEDGRKNESNPAERYVLMRRAGEVARNAGEAELMLEAVDAMTAAGFNIQSLQVKAWLLKGLAERGPASGASQVSAFSGSCVKFAEEAAASGAVDEASDVLDAARKALAEPKKRAQTAQRTARAAIARTRNPADKAAQEKKAAEAQGELEEIDSVLGELTDCAKNLQQARREHEAIQAAQEQLKTEPDDPDACLAVGRWYCFYKGDWETGLALLAKGSDDALKSLAGEELASKPAKADERVARGDAWWDTAEKAAGRPKAAMRWRAGHWYQEAMPDLAPGLGKSRVEKRLAQAAEEEPPEAHAASARSRPPLAVAPFDAQKANEHQEAWAKYLRVPVEMTNAIGMKLVLIPPGEFTMGEGGDAHKVTITKAFYLGKYEVTQEEWAAVMGSNPSHFKGPKNPVEKVSWDDCQAFLKRLSEMVVSAQGGQRKRPKGKLVAVRGSYALPTEAQWEYACRAGSTGGWCFGDAEVELAQYGWHEKNSEKRTHPVGEKKPNAWGLYDMHGNVWEWCADWLGPYDKESSVNDPTGPPSGSRRVTRGGCWSDGGGSCQSAYRGSNVPGHRSSYLGLRVSLVLADN